MPKIIALRISLATYTEKPGYDNIPNYSFKTSSSDVLALYSGGASFLRSFVKAKDVFNAENATKLHLKWLIWFHDLCTHVRKE
jgi:hypothetical protein